MSISTSSVQNNTEKPEQTQNPFGTLLLAFGGMVVLFGFLYYLSPPIADRGNLDDKTDTTSIRLPTVVVPPPTITTGRVDTLPKQQIVQQTKQKDKTLYVRPRYKSYMEDPIYDSAQHLLKKNIVPYDMYAKYMQLLIATYSHQAKDCREEAVNKLKAEEGELVATHRLDLCCQLMRSILSISHNDTYALNGKLRYNCE